MKMFKPTIPNMEYHANDWGIVTKKEKEIERISGLEFLSSNYFYGRCVEWLSFSLYDFENMKSIIEEKISNRWFFAIITGKNMARKITLVNNTPIICMIFHIWNCWFKHFHKSPFKSIM